jgi:pyruvate kinase
MLRRTKIICTLGPASNDRETISDMINAGMNVARMNFSHGTHEDHARRIKLVRECAAELDRPVSILQDLQGPKIRVGPMKDGGVLLENGQTFTLTSTPLDEGTSERAYISYNGLAQDVQEGKHILLDDGLLELVVKEARGADVITEVMVGGPLRSHKGVNLPHIKNSVPSLTDKDLRDLDFGLEQDVDIIALSFVRSETDVSDLLRRIRASGKQVSVVSKIEKPEAVEKIDAIIARSDGIMVARGDLGIEMPLAEVPGTQKTIIQKCLAAAKPVITATQMLESMVENPRPTRAEASDVANAVLDGSDAVMLSGETAAGKYPVRVVEVMANIVKEAERSRRFGAPAPRLRPQDMTGMEVVTESISYTAVELAEQVGAVAIACLTSSGATARGIARHRPKVPIFAFTDNERAVGQLGLLWGTKAFAIPFQRDTDEGIRRVHQYLVERELVRRGDLIVMTAGMPLPARGRTNMVHVTRI